MESKNQKPSDLYHIGLGNLWEEAHFSDIGIVSIIRQRLKDIELQRWFSEMNNDLRKGPNQSNKMRTYREVKTIDNNRMRGLPSPGHQHPAQNHHDKTAT